MRHEHRRFLRLCNYLNLGMLSGIVAVSGGIDCVVVRTPEPVRPIADRAPARRLVLTATL
jgi:hypothetical protein